MARQHPTLVVPHLPTLSVLLKVFPEFLYLYLTSKRFHSFYTLKLISTIIQGVYASDEYGDSTEEHT